MSNNKENFISLLEKYENNVVVPIIQRGYAQGRKTHKVRKIREDFLDVIIDFLSNDKEELILDYIYGVEDNDVFYLLDGQQRLTTLFLFHWYFNFNDEILKRFTYETRNSSKNFISFLLSIKREEIKLKSNENLSDKLKDNIKFLNFWEKDTTVKGMLQVIDDIHEKVKNKKDINSSKLNRIQFYYEYIKGDPDDLYIKMNSRGKQLTDFEIFKSKLESFLDGKIDDDLLREFREKIDTTWSNFFWEFVKDNKNPEIDSLFKNFFDFVFGMLYSEQCEYIKEKNEKIGVHLKDFFNLFVKKTDEKMLKYIDDSKNFVLECNIKFIINILDIFYKLKPEKNIELFNNIFCIYDRNIYNDKISTFEENINIFDKKNEDIILLKINNYDLKYQILLFSFFIVLNKIYEEENYKESENIDSIIEKIKDYTDTLRFIRNFIFIYYEHIGNDDELKFQISFIKSFIENGEIALKPYDNNNQEILKIIVESEKNKLNILKSCNQNIRKRIYVCENNIFLQGNINFILDYLVSSECNDNIVGIINHIFTEDGFNNENENENYLIHRAMLSFISKQQIISKGIIDTSKMYKDYNIWNNKENNKKGFINFIKDISKKINDKNIKEDIKKSINEICQNIIDNPEKYMKDENDFRYLLIKDAKDGDGNITNLFKYSNNKKLINNILYHKKNVNIYDILLNTNIYKILKRIQKHNREFNFYVFHPDNSIEESNDWYYLRYNNGEILYLYSYLMFAYKLEKNDCYIGFLILKNIMYIGIIYDDNKKNNKMEEKITKKFGEHWIHKRYISYKCFVLHYYDIFNNTIDDEESNLTYDKLYKSLNSMIKELSEIKTFIEEL